MPAMPKGGARRPRAPEPALMIHAFVDLAAELRPVSNELSCDGVRLKSCAPPVTVINTSGLARCQYLDMKVASRPTETVSETVMKCRGERDGENEICSRREGATAREGATTVATRLISGRGARCHAKHTLPYEAFAPECIEKRLGPKHEKTASRKRKCCWIIRIALISAALWFERPVRSRLRLPIACSMALSTPTKSLKKAKRAEPGDSVFPRMALAGGLLASASSSAVPFLSSPRADRSWAAVIARVIPGCFVACAADAGLSFTAHVSAESTASSEELTTVTSLILTVAFVGTFVGCTDMSHGQGYNHAPARPGASFVGSWRTQRRPDGCVEER